MCAMIRDAHLDQTRTYRYTLRRIWDEGSAPVVWIMLNPSTADETDDDRTIGRCVAFAQTWGAGGIVVCNLFAFRSRDPEDLWTAADPVGPENDETLRREAVGAQMVIAAWGEYTAGAFRRREAAVRKLLDRPLFHLGLTKRGHPRHPLYVPGDRGPSMWERHR